MRRRNQLRLSLIASLLIVLAAVAWTRTRGESGTTAITLATQPVGTTFDPATGRVYIANAGLNGSGRTVSVVDLRRGRLLRALTVGRGPVDVAVDAATRRVFVVDQGYDDDAGHHGGSVSVLDAATGRPIRIVAFDRTVPSGVTIDQHTGHALVTVYGGATGRAVYELDGRDGRLLSTSAWVPLAEDAALQQAVVAYGSSVRLVNLRTGAQIRTLWTSVVPGPATIEDLRHRAYVVNYTASKVGIVDLASGTVRRTLAAGHHPFALAFDRHDRRFFVLNQGYFDGSDTPRSPGSLTIIDARRDAVVQTILLGLFPAALALDERRGLVLVTTCGPTDASGNPTGTGQLYVIDARRGTIVRTVSTGVGPFHIVVDEQTGKALVVNALGDGSGSYASQPWFLAWLLPRSLPHGTAQIVDLRKLSVGSRQ